MTFTAPPTKQDLVDLWAVHLGQDAKDQAAANALAHDDTRTWVDPNGYKLSGRIWNQRNDTRAMIEKEIQTALEQRTSAVDLAKRLEVHLNPEHKPVRYANGRIAPAGDARKGVYTKTPYGSSGSYPARRLARTEITRAHGAATISAATATGDYLKWLLSGSHPKQDICDDHALSNDHGFGAGVYPPKDVPRYPAHPHCLCTLIVVNRLDIGSTNPRLDRINRARDAMGLPPLEEAADGTRYVKRSTPSASSAPAPAAPTAPAQPAPAPPPMAKPTVPMTQADTVKLKGIDDRIAKHAGALTDPTIVGAARSRAQTFLDRAIGERHALIDAAEQAAKQTAAMLGTALQRSKLPARALPLEHPAGAARFLRSAVTDGMDEFDHTARAAAIKAINEPGIRELKRLQDEARAIIDKVPAGQRNAIRRYTGFNYRDMNYNARGQNKTRGELKFAGDVKLIQRAMDRDTTRLASDVKLHRGSRFSAGFPPEWKRMKPGDTVTDWGFSSTSLFDTVSEKFRQGRGDSYTLELLAPKGSKALPAWGLSHHGTEHEVLLPRGATFIVHEVTRRKSANGKGIVMHIIGELLT